MLSSGPTGPVQHGHTGSEKLSMKAEVAIYSQVVDASGQFMSISLILGFNLDASSCDNLVGFCKFSHKCHLALLISLALLHLYQKGPNCFLFYQGWLNSLKVVGVQLTSKTYFYCKKLNSYEHLQILWGQVPPVPSWFRRLCFLQH